MKAEFSSAIGGVHNDAPLPLPATRRVVCSPHLYDGRYTGRVLPVVQMAYVRSDI